MSLGFLRFVLSRALSRRPLQPVSHIIAPSSALRPAWGHLTTPPCQRVSFCTDAESVDVTDLPKETKKPDPRARVTFSSVGRKIGQRLIRLLGEDGEELGTMHRAEVIRMMDQTGLKLVAINENSDPPLYRLMKGKQIHEEQMRLRETQKAKTGVFISCLSVSSVFFKMFLKAITILSLFTRQSKQFVYYLYIRWCVYLQALCSQRSWISLLIFLFMIWRLNCVRLSAGWRRRITSDSRSKAELTAAHPWYDTQLLDLPKFLFYLYHVAWSLVKSRPNLN